MSCGILNTNRILIILAIANFLILSSAPASSSLSNDWWDSDWSFRQEIKIAIDTSNEIAKFQPIDIRINFENPCWAKSPEEHSVRVILHSNGLTKELDSQIYDLEETSNNIISSCSLVFLIPEEADGNEKYYVYYDGDEKTPTSYIDHVDVEESYYYFAPIPIYPFESDFYKITEDGDIVYGVAYEGELLAVGTTQQVTKFKEGTKEVSTPKDVEAWASFDFFYNYADNLRGFSSTLEKLVSKQILVDGNLMVKFRITSRSSLDDFETDAVYTYYYSPLKNKKISANVKHEALKEAHVVRNSEYSVACGNIGGLQVGDFTSPSIKELNFGRIYPYLHLYSEDGIIREYSLDTDPEYNTEGIDILSTEDDIDLGDYAWTCYDEGEDGAAHGYIFDSNNPLISGTDEREGAQVKSFEYSPPRVLGLEIDMASYYFTRNSFEKGLADDYIIPEDYVVEYNAEFFSTYSGGYKTVDEEAKVFQTLVKERPETENGETINNEEDVETYTLTAHTHFAPSFPLGTTLSILTGKNFSYIAGELYKDDKLLLTGIGERLTLNGIPDLSNTTLIEKIKMIGGIFDLRNISLSKKIKFYNLKPGQYLVKIYKVNPLIGKERKYIGFKIVDVQENTKTRIFCKQQGSINVSVTDQNNEGVKDVKAKLVYKNVTIAEEVTSDNGFATLYAPCDFIDKYNLVLLYKGFIIHDETIRLGFIRAVKPHKISVKVELYSFNLKVKDTWELNPTYRINPILTSNDMAKIYNLAPDSINENSYLFNNLIPGEYNLKIDYKTFTVEEKITINGDEELEITFPAEFEITVYSYNCRGTPLEKAHIKVEREGKVEKIECNKNGISKIVLPPGIYDLKVYDCDEQVAKRKITIVGGRAFDVVTTKEPIFPYIVMFSAIVFLIAGIGIFFRRKDKMFLLKIIVIAIAVIAIAQPWWNMHGTSPDSKIEMSSNIYLIPAELTTLTKGPNIEAGELGLESLPEILTNVMVLLSIAISISCILLIANIVFNKFNKKRLAQIAFIFAVLFLVISLGVFYYATSLMAKVGVGGFLGEGDIDTSILGEGGSIKINSNWGPSFGFYLCLISTLILIGIFIYRFKKERYLKTKWSLRRKKILFFN